MNPTLAMQPLTAVCQCTLSRFHISGMPHNKVYQREGSNNGLIDILAGTIVWKKKYLYTVIDYHDGLGDQSIVLDFHRSIEKAQALIYQRMILSRRKEWD